MVLKEEIDKLLEAGTIFPSSYSECVSPITVVPKENKKTTIMCGLPKVE